jgi:uridylate kinase
MANHMETTTTTTTKPIYQRILLKLSGEALQGDHLFGINAAKLTRISQEVAPVVQAGNWRR